VQHGLAADGPGRCDVSVNLVVHNKMVSWIQDTIVRDQERHYSLLQQQLRRHIAANTAAIQTPTSPDAKIESPEPIISPPPSVATMTKETPETEATLVTKRSPSHALRNASLFAALALLSSLAWTMIRNYRVRRVSEDELARLRQEVFTLFETYARRTLYGDKTAYMKDN
jgi:hypothetical protein